MSDLVKQNGTNQDAPGTGGKYQLKNSVYGSSNGDRIDNSQEISAGRTISTQRLRILQGTGTKFAYPAGKSEEQVS